MKLTVKENAFLFEVVAIGLKVGKLKILVGSSVL